MKYYDEKSLCKNQPESYISSYDKEYFCYNILIYK